MDEQKRLLLAVVLSVVVLVGYQTFFVKSPELNNQPVQIQEDRKADQVQKTSPHVSEYKAQPSVVPQPVEPQKKNYRTISVSTPLYNIAISEQGAAVKSIELKNFKATNKKGSPLKQLVPEQLISGTLFFDLEGQSIPGLKNAVYTAKGDATATSVFDGEKTIEFTFGTPQGMMVKKIFTFKANSYMIDCDIVFQNGSDMPLNDSLVISTPGFFNEETKKRSRFAFEGPVVLIDDEYTAIKPGDIEDKNTYHGKIDWSGYSERYFMTAVMPKKKDEGSANDAIIKLSYINDMVTNDYIQKMDRLDPGKQSSYSFTFYMGPKSQKVLGQYDNSLKNAINFGFFNIIAKPLLITMNVIYGVIPNYGIAIILLTILIKL
ncbi:MAG: membrane protein insertase YidC, partial [Desulfobacula sp.]|nr:membrane protein insertase YidC [Desulfobacula sp.]